MCTPCSSNARTCSLDKAFIRTCKEIPGSSCHEIILERCQIDKECRLVKGLPFCVLTTCGKPCLEGSFRCDTDASKNTILVRCNKDPKTSCTAFETAKICETGTGCQASSGTCSKKACVMETLQSSKGCHNNAVHWFDNCDTRGEMLRQCKEGEVCQKGLCQVGQCTVKKPESELKCVKNSIHWFDDCGKQGRKVSDCPVGDICKNATCEKKPKPVCPNPCQTLGETKCDGTDSQMKCIPSGKPSCNVWSTTTKCPSKICASGKCKKPCNNTCTSGQKKCTNDKLQLCQKDADGCLVWGAEQSCPVDQTCASGGCQQKTGSPIGFPCQKKEECITDQCLVKPSRMQGVCSKLCNGTSCGTGNTCISIRLNDGTSKNHCFKSCRFSSECEGRLFCQNNLCQP